jgi:uncharacterized membrane protein YfcA
MEHVELLLFFLLVAFVYASVGFGGGSSYIAILAMYALPFPELCNIIVVTGSTFVYIKNKQVDWKKILPLVAASIPLAYLGATLKLSENVFFIILGCSLLLASALLWIKTKTVEEAVTNKSNPTRNAAYGGAIGFLSGMVGIGGGIFLSPILNLSNWDTSKKIAATASVFILANSIAGLAGQLSQLPVDINYTRTLLLCAAVLIGGQLGSRISVKKFDLLSVRRITAVLVFIAGIEVLIKHLPF